MDDDLNPLEHAHHNGTRAQTAEERAAKPRTPFYDRYGRSLSQALEASSSTDDDDKMKHGSLGGLLNDQASPDRSDLATERRQPEHQEEADPVLSEDEEASDGSGGAGVRWRMTHPPA